jgi:tetratricopeptide (TPR) repeat protein
MMTKKGKWYMEVHELFFANKHNEVISILKPIINSNSGTIEQHYLYAQSLYYTKNYDVALGSFEYVIREMSHRTPVEFYQMTRTTLEKLNEVDQNLFWNKCSDKPSKIFQKSFIALVEGDLSSSSLYFSEGANIVFSKEKEKELWKRSFDIVAYAFLGLAQSEINYEPRFCKKIFVSGKGWSGSGAVFDYLREFENVIGIPVETQYIESNKGISNLIKNSKDKKDFSLALLDFFYHCMLGYCEYQDSESFKIFFGPRSIMESELSLTYSINAHEISKLIALTLMNFSEPSGQELKTLYNQIVNRLAINDLAGGDTYALLDNVIHISNIDIINVLEDVSVFCTFRDPRSNYVSLSRKRAVFNQSCEEFIEQELKSYPRLLEKINDCTKNIDPNSKRKVFKVQFEEFVLSDEYRKYLAHQIGLDLRLQHKHKYFKPWESARNVMLHQEHEKQDEIDKIKLALMDYCVEPSIMPFKK